MAIQMLTMIKGIKKSIESNANERQLDDKEMDIINRFDYIIEMLD